MILKFLLCLFVIYLPNIHAENNDIILDENKLQELVKNDNPTIEKINTLYQQNIVNELSFKNNYSYKLYGDAKYKKADDNWTQWDFSGTNDETNFGIGITKNSMYGMSSSISINDVDGNYYTSSIGNYDVNRSGLNITYSIDLWKNFLGYQTGTQDLNIKLSKEQAKIKTFIEKNNFYYSLRSIYWKMVSKSRELDFYEIMIEQANKNLNNIQKRYKNHIADAGDLARAKANVNLRKTQYKNIEIELENLKKTLKYHIPELMNKNIIINTFDLTELFTSIMSCNKTIYNNTNKYIDLTSYNEYINLMDKIIDTEIKTLDRENDFDVKLDLSANFRGIDENINNSFDDFTNFDRNEYSIGLKINKNLGNNGNNLKLEKTKLAKMNYNYNKQNTLANLNSFYNSYENIMKNMFTSLNNLHSYKKNMDTRLNSSKIKYNQGRLSLNDLIQDEDNLISANIQLIEMENIIIDTILQYLSVFDKTSCDFNIKVNE